MAYKTFSHFPERNTTASQDFFMSCFHFHNLKRHPLIAVSVMDSLSTDWKISRNEGSKPHQAAAPVTHCPPGQNSCSTSQPAISGCCHLVLLQIVHIQWSLQLLSTGSALSPLCSTVNKPSSLQCSLKHLHKAPPCPQPAGLLCSFSKSFCPGVHTLKVSTDMQPHW